MGQRSEERAGRDRPIGPAPGREVLREAALTYLGRFSTTETGLLRVLDRRIERWLRRAAAERGEEAAQEAAASRREARAVVSDLAALGVVNDRAYAEARAYSLARSGRSRRAVATSLGAKGVARDLAAAVLPSPEQELAQALAFARRRRFGPFRAGEPTPERNRRELASLARAGFPPGVARRAIQTPLDEAEAIVNALRRE